jgi:hypothetical protein
MKSLLIGLFAAVSLFFAGCGQKPAEITSASPTSSPSPKEIVREPNTPATPYSSVTEAGVTPETAPSPSPSAASKGELVFKTGAAIQAASQYLNTYNKLLNDINARPSTKGMDPQTGLSNIKDQLQRIAQDTAELANQESRVQQVLTPDEMKRLLQYRENVKQETQTDQEELGR